MADDLYAAYIPTPHLAHMQGLGASLSLHTNFREISVDRQIHLRVLTLPHNVVNFLGRFSELQPNTGFEDQTVRRAPIVELHHAGACSVSKPLSMTPRTLNISTTTKERLCQTHHTNLISFVQDITFSNRHLATAHLRHPHGHKYHRSEPPISRPYIHQSPCAHLAEISLTPIRRRRIKLLFLPGSITARARGQPRTPSEARPSYLPHLLHRPCYRRVPAVVTQCLQEALVDCSAFETERFSQLLVLVFVLLILSFTSLSVSVWVQTTFPRWMF